MTKTHPNKHAGWKLPPLSNFEPPEHMTDPVARREYSRVATAMGKAGMVTALDVMMLALHAEGFATATKFKRHIERCGLTQRIVGRNGHTSRIVLHPAAGELFRWLRSVDQVDRRLQLPQAVKRGLLPASVIRPVERLREFANSL